MFYTEDLTEALKPFLLLTLHCGSRCRTVCRVVNQKPKHGPNEHGMSERTVLFLEFHGNFALRTERKRKGQVCYVYNIYNIYV